MATTTASIPIYPDLASKVAVVTGGSGGIGAQTCEFFAANRMKVAVNGRDQNAIEAVVSGIRDASGEAIGVVADCTREDDLAALVETTESQLGPIDVLAAFAGFDVGAPAPLTDLKTDEWCSVIEGNLTATFLTLSAVVPGMVTRGRGSVITMSSAAGRLPGWSSIAYASAKAGILMLTRRVAADVGAHHVRVNALAPSAILTAKQERTIPRAVRDKVTEEQFVLGRWGTPTDCANAALFLASEASDWITGDTIDIAGGKIMM